MKKILIILTFALLTFSSFAQVGIGTKNAAPSAVLDVSSTTKGFLPPRVTPAERNAIASPPAGLVVYNTTDNRLEFSNGTQWVNLNDGSVIVAVNTATNTGTGGVAMGTKTPNPAAILDVTSTNKGFLPPRLTTIERDAITSPAQGLTIYNTTNGCIEFYNTTFWVSACDGSFQPGPLSKCSESGFIAPFITASQTKIVPIQTATGRTWMDRNLGASTAARTATDCFAYGNLYQWGRNSDGHENRLSGTQSGPIASNISSSNFITTSGADWLSTSVTNRWNTQTEATPLKSGNDPCPAGYRVPTISEIVLEIQEFTSQNAAGAFNYSLKFSLAGRRRNSDGLLINVGTIARYWASTSGTGSDDDSGRQFNYDTTNFNPNGSLQSKSWGQSVRCIKI